MACFFTVAGDDVQYASGQQVTDDFHQQQDGSGSLLGGFQDDGATGRQGGGQFPGGHQQREVPRDDLADHADRLVEVVSNRGAVHIRDAALLCAQATGKVAEMVDGQRQAFDRRHPTSTNVVVVTGFEREFQIQAHGFEIGQIHDVSLLI